MLASLVGSFDAPSAAVMIAFFIGCGIVIAALLGRRTKLLEVENDFEIKKATLQRDFEIGKLKLNQNLITSHRSKE